LRQIGARWEYRLGCPNQEAESALNDALLKGLLGNAMRAERAVSRLYDVLVSGDFDALRRHIASLFASIPHQWHDGNPIARSEGYYASGLQGISLPSGFQQLIIPGVKLLGTGLPRRGQSRLGEGPKRQGGVRPLVASFRIQP
jgi:hypothetical protein